MRAIRVTLWILVAVVAFGACRGDITADDSQSSTTTKVEECSWCPALDPSGTTTVGQSASSPPDLKDLLASTAGGTAFAGITEEELLSDIGETCDAWEGNTSRGDAAARVAGDRAHLLGVPESAAVLESYTQLLETSADQRCLRDPTR